MSLFDSGIRPVIDQYLLDEAAKVRDYGSYWSASSAGYCMRKQIFQRLGVPEVSKDARKQRVFSAGHIFHNWIQELTRNAGISVAQEVELQDEDLMVRGHFDDLVLVRESSEITKDPPGVLIKDHLILYDYKTVNSRSFTYAKANGNALSYYHKMQLGTYMSMLRQQPTGVLPKSMHESWLKNLAEARILKISKDDLRMDEQQLLWTPELEAEVVEYWSTLNEYWASRKIPKCTCGDHEGGFLAREKYNPYFWKGEPCSLEYYKLFKEGKLDDKLLQA